MTEYPILFNGEMVRAILADRKTQTRRPIRMNGIAYIGGCDDDHNNPDLWGYEGPDAVWYVLGRGHSDTTHGGDCSVQCPYGVPGDQLWVRETWRYNGTQHYTPRGTSTRAIEASVTYRADGKRRSGLDVAALWPDRLPQQRPPKSLSEFERDQWLARWWQRWRPNIHMPRWACRQLLDVTAVRVERLRAISGDDMVAEGVRHDGTWWLGSDHPAKGTPKCFPAIEYALADRWDDIYAERGYGWAKNPFVWVIEFRRAQP